MDVSRFEFVVRAEDLDAYGHVNNATYFVYFERARWELCVARGFGPAQVQLARRGPVVLEAHVQFKRELALGAPVHILTQLQSHRGKISEIKQELFDDRDQLCCAAVFTMGLFDLDARRLVEPTPDWKRVLGVE